MKRSCTFLALFLLSIAFGQASFGWTDSTTTSFANPGGPATQAKLLLQRPSGTGLLQGMIVVACRQSGNSKNGTFLQTATFRAMADARKVAIIAICPQNNEDGLIGFGPANGNADSINSAVQRLVASAGTPELALSPIVAVGFGPLAAFARNLGYLLPARVVAVASIRPLNLDAPVWANSAPFSPDALKNIPHLVMSGQLSGPDITNNNGPYLTQGLRASTFGRRTANELVHQVVEMNATQNTLKEKTINYLSLFIGKSFEKRVPANINTTAAPAVLNALTEASGFLAKSDSANSFDPSSFSTGAFGTAGFAPATSQWLFDTEHADAWRAFHTDPFASLNIVQQAIEAIPYTSGSRPSSLDMTATLSANAVINPTSVMRIEVSDIRSDFDNERVPARFVGTKKINGLSTTFTQVIMPDNFQFQSSTYSPIAKRFRIRVSTSDPYQEGRATPQILYWNIVRPADVYMSTARPLKYRYNPGDSVSFTIYKTATSTITDTLQLQLSDTSGYFTNGIDPTTLTVFVPNFVGDSMFVKTALPLAGLPSYSYRIRVAKKSGSSPRNPYSSCGHELPLTFAVNALERSFSSPASSFSLVPNPSAGSTQLRFASTEQSKVVEVYTLSGARKMTFAVAKGQVSAKLNAAGLAPSIYIIRVIAGKATAQTRWVVQ